MIEIPVLNLQDVKSRKSEYGLVVCDESAITCQNLGKLKAKVEQLGTTVILMMHEDQYQKGMRGFAKAQILNSIVKLVGVLPVGDEELALELRAGWKSVYIPAPFINHEKRLMVGIKEKSAQIDFPVSNSVDDRRWIDRAREIVSKSNCWYDPAGCVFTRGGQSILESVSTNYNHNHCKQIPIDFREIPLNPGERMVFCDSQHAERVGVATAAREGISLDGSTMYVSKFPCRPCIQSILEAGVKEVVFERESYGVPDAQLLLDNGVEIRRVRG